MPNKFRVFLASKAKTVTLDLSEIENVRYDTIANADKNKIRIKLLEKLQSHPEIETLNLNLFFFTNEEFNILCESLSTLSNLTSLNLSCCALDDKKLLKLAQVLENKNIRKLNLSGYNNSFTAPELNRFLRRVGRNLESLTLNFIRLMPANYTYVDQALRALPKLSILSIEGLEDFVSFSVKHHFHALERLFKDNEVLIILNKYIKYLYGHGKFSELKKFEHCIARGWERKTDKAPYSSNEALRVIAVLLITLPCAFTQKRGNDSLISLYTTTLALQARDQNQLLCKPETTEDDISWLPIAATTFSYEPAYVADFLLKNGYDLNSRINSHGNTFFLFYISNGRWEKAYECLTLLCPHYGLDRFNINLGSEIYGTNPLQLVAAKGYRDLDAELNPTGKSALELVQKLIECGADVNLPTAKKLGANTALHIACARRDSEMMKVLVEGGADSQRKNAQGLTPLQMIQLPKENARQLIDSLCGFGNCGCSVEKFPLHNFDDCYEPDTAKLINEYEAMLDTHAEHRRTSQNLQDRALTYLNAYNSASSDDDIESHSVSTRVTFSVAPAPPLALRVKSGI